jgi:sugar O-acyltransferase (sialic acid O-acetyltransferase NeuD family)
VIGITPTQLAVYGSGGSGREVAWLAQCCNVDQDRYRVVCFVDDNQAMHGALVNSIPVMGLPAARTRFPEARIAGGVGSPQVRQRLMEKAAAVGFGFETLVHPQVQCSSWLEIGAGTVICAGSILTVNIVLGQHVQINLDCTISHDVVMGDYVTLAPGVHVCGSVHLGRRVWVGAGAVVFNGTPADPIVIGDDAVIGAGACVTKSVAPGVTVVGVPARPLERRA